MRTVSTRTAAGRCNELQKELPQRSDYLEACYDFYRFNADGIERESNLDAVLRAAAKDTLHQGLGSTDGANQRRDLKGCHRIVLPGTMGPVRTPAWLHFETTTFPPDYSLVEGVRLFCVGGPEGSRRGCERHGKSYLTRRRRGEEGDGGGSLTGGAIPSA